MKKVYALSMKLWSFWVLLPIGTVLVLSIIYNDGAPGYLKLYPLMLMSAAAVIFSFIYLFRAVMISWCEIRMLGRFSSRDSAVIDEGKTLVLEIAERSRVNVRLYGNEGYNPDIKWLTTDDETGGDICTFRAKTYEGKRGVKRILRYFGVPDTDFDEILGENDISKKYEKITVTTSVENEKKVIRIRFDETV